MNLAEAVKQVGDRIRAAAIAFTSSGGGSTWTSWQRTGYSDYGTVDDAANNSIVQACALWIQTTFPEAPMRVLDKGGKEVEDHPMVDLVDFPNPYYDGALLWQATLADYTVNGNTYWLKVRSGGKRVVQLYWVPNWLVEPRWPSSGDVFIDHYEYRPNGRAIDYPIEDVVHYRFGLNFETRKGVSRLNSVLGEVFTDREAQLFTAAILKNLGVPGLMVIPANDKVTVSRETAEETRNEIEARFSSGGRGRAMVARAPIDVKVLSFSPEQMQFKELRRLPEERVTSVLGIPAGVVGVGAGLDRNTFSNYAEAREAAYEQQIIPTQRIFAQAVRRQLLVDFTDDRKFTVDFDLSKVRVLQDDQDKLTTRTVNAFRGGVIDWAEARTAVGARVERDQEGVYLVSGTTKYTTKEDLLNPPEPPPQPGQPGQPGTAQQPGQPAVPPPPGKNGQKPPAEVPAKTKEVDDLTPEEVEELFAERWRLVEAE